MGEGAAGDLCAWEEVALAGHLALDPSHVGAGEGDEHHLAVWAVLGLHVCAWEGERGGLVWSWGWGWGCGWGCGWGFSWGGGEGWRRESEGGEARGTCF